MIAIVGRAGGASIVDEEFGTIELPADFPTQAAWEAQSKRYQTAQRNDDTDGAASVHAYVAALPGWKRAVATRFDELIEPEVSGVRRAVNWYQPFYAVEDRGWFASISAFKNHVKLFFVAGTYLDPEPPTASDPDRQPLDVTDGTSLDDAESRPGFARLPTIQG
ncbi:DUF1801 domain-containing protein [Salinarchaeum laminariae]|uniref:DUF1801 domain-containing protein n=1 Tax=Salinarchaeum laminariae TaxID=869888 RepID=UPI0020C0A1F5|nr:DUF1801 domain-containing protein [Salinarchaeum laminariae]